MTKAQLLVLVGTIWIAPHLSPKAGLLGGICILIVASLEGLGWI